MESSDLRVFQMVAREGSISKAASRLGYVQSNVTARVRHLESELGTVLFFRHNRGMTLSSSGQTLLVYTDKIVGMLDEAAKALSSAHEPSGPLTIGSSQTTAAVRLPKLLTAYYSSHPKVILSLTTGNSPQLVEKVLRYEMDGAFIGVPCDHPELHSVPVFDEEVVLVSHASLTQLEAALSKPLLVYSTGCLYRHMLEQWLLSLGLAQPVVMELGTLEAIIGGVSAGLGISLLPRVVIDKHEAEGAVLAHTVPESMRRMKTEFVTRKDTFQNSALRAFIGMLPRDGSSHP